MGLHDLHLYAETIGEGSKQRLRQLAFVEDFFEDGVNCRTGSYHATYRGKLCDINELLWNELVAILQGDIDFVGILEEERSISLARTGFAGDAMLPHVLEAGPFKSSVDKACDVHIGVRIEGGSLLLNWMDSLNIASFRKRRDDGYWRIYSATFCSIEAGRLFYNSILEFSPNLAPIVFKAQLEETVRTYKKPYSAEALPLTYDHQLDAWLARFGVSRAR